jgi:hypothetical protein
MLATALAARSAVPAFAALAEIEQCTQAGYSSLMADGSQLRHAYLTAVQTVLPAVLSTHDSLALWRAGREAVTHAAVGSIHALTGRP